MEWDAQSRMIINELLSGIAVQLHQQLVRSDLRIGVIHCVVMTVLTRRRTGNSLMSPIDDIVDLKQIIIQIMHKKTYNQINYE